jgi:hypothetical protein
MRLLSAYDEVIGRTDRAATDMDAEFAEAREKRTQEYERQEAEQRELREQREAEQAKLAEQQPGDHEQGSGSATRPDREVRSGVAELDFAPEDDEYVEGSEPPRSTVPATPQRRRRAAGRARFDPEAGADDYDDDDDFFLNRTWLV